MSTSEPDYIRLHKELADETATAPKKTKKTAKAVEYHLGGGGTTDLNDTERLLRLVRGNDDNSYDFLFRALVIPRRAWLLNVLSFDQRERLAKNLLEHYQKTKSPRLGDYGDICDEAESELVSPTTAAASAHRHRRSTGPYQRSARRTA